MILIADTEAKRIVNAVLANLEGRSGFDIINLIMDADEVYREMYDSLVKDTMDAAGSNDNYTKNRFYPRTAPDAPKR